MGILVGVVQGGIFRPLYMVSVFGLMHLISGVVASRSLLVLLSNVFVSIGAGGFLLLPLVFAAKVVVWKNFVAGWAIGFAAGAIAYQLVAVLYRHKHRRH